MEAVVNAKNLRISTKHSVEVCNMLRDKTTKKAKTLLSEVLEMKRAVPYTKFLGDLSHKRGMAAGRYPIKSCEEILRIIESGESNALNKGMGSDLIISHISAHKAGKQFHYGRKLRTKMKNTHITLKLKEAEKKK